MNIAEKMIAGPTDSLDQPAEPRRHGGASIIANEIDIALSPIALYADALLEHEALSERARQYLASIRRAVDDVAHNVARLRELDRPRETCRSHGYRERTTASSARSLRVLLIDDDPSLIESLRSALIDEGHKVTTANGGQAGIDTFRAAHSSGLPFDIVITDLSMPDVDGRQVVANLRAISRRHSHHPADRLAASAGGRRRAFAARGPAVRQAAAHSRVAHGAGRAHRAPHYRPAEVRVSGIARLMTPATMSAAPAMRQGPESSRNSREPNHAPTSVDNSRAGATWLMGARRIANKHQDVSQRPEHAHHDHWLAIGARLERDTRAIAPGARREHHHAKQVAGEIDDERRDQQHFHGPSVIECVGCDQRAGEQPVKHADARRTAVMPDDPRDQQDATDDQQQAGNGLRRRALRLTTTRRR